MGWFTNVGNSYDDPAYVTIAYYDVTNGDLKLARKSTDRDGGQPWSDWVLTVLDSVGDVGKFANMIAYGDPEIGDEVHITYYDATNGNLKYFKKWPVSIETWDSDGDVGDSILQCGLMRLIV